MKRKAILENLCLFAGSLLICFLFFEFIVFKYVFNTSDAIPNTSINNIIRYQPGTKATLYEPDGASHVVTINENGWNSTIKRYSHEKPAGVTRIAVIGDSYVQASAVNPEESFAEIIGQTLAMKGRKVEVYRFGIDGAPLSQYLYMLENEALQYKPDIVVIQLIHNDFDETYRFLYGRYASSFMKLNLSGETIREIPPASYKPGLIDLLKHSRTFRYLYYQTGLALTVRRLINKEDEKEKDEKPPKHGFIQSAIDVRNIREHEKINKATRYVFERLRELSQQKGFKLLLTMDPVREAIYAGNRASEYEANSLNEIAQKTAKEVGLSFLDLQSAFTADYKKNSQRFEFPWDWHWNKHGNETAGKAIAKDLELQFLLNPRENVTEDMSKAP